MARTRRITKNYFKKCAVIIDCFEFFCERPKPVKARAQTYSNYKHHNTVKFLIGIAPQGVITFISKGWGDRFQIDTLLRMWGFERILLPGDQILADRGFNIQESAVLYCAEVKIPPFTKVNGLPGGRVAVDIDAATRLAKGCIAAQCRVGGK